MHRLPLYTLALAILGLGCGSTPDALSDAGPDDVLAALEHDTGQKWTVRYHADLHTPAFLDGKTPPIAATSADAERAGRNFLAQYRGLYQMTSSADELATVDALTDELGMTHARFAQQQNKIPVWGGELIVHFASDGSLVRINGRYQPLPMLPQAPARTADDARAAALTDAHAARPDVGAGAFTALAPKLWIYPTSASDARLAWRVEIEVSDLDRPMLLETFVDATDGSILHRMDTLAFVGPSGSGAGVFGEPRQFPIAERRGRFWLEDATHGSPAQKIYSVAGRSKLPGGEVSSKETDHWDETGDGHGAAVDAHVFVAAVYDYFAQVHGRAGWEGHGKGVHASVHFGHGYPRAFFDGNRLVFGDGDGNQLAPLAGALDIVAHEFTHGVVHHTARLQLTGQSGALAEGLCDVFAAFVATQLDVGHPWLLGDSVHRVNGKPQPIRDATHPHATQNPASMSEYVDTTDDNGGVHVNSTIVSHAAYLMTQSLGAKLSSKIWYRALSRYLTSRATFADAADATASAARELGAGEQQVRDAWVAAGVLSE
ncbi:MAG TPA: M4 family metallopeptidase [Polyangia bacterium]|nr:M4 family metallopeptidase [Polyangia bacterium]